MFLTMFDMFEYDFRLFVICFKLFLYHYFGFMKSITCMFILF